VAINTSLGTSSAATVMPSTSKTRYQFGEFVFDSNQDELVFAATGQREKLEPKVAELLCLFITHAGQVLDKDTLQAQLWPNTVVEQNSLYQLLTKLRRTLGCPPKQPKYIKTLPKKGYCFIADVTKVITDVPPAPKPFANEPRQTKPSTPTAPTLWASKNKWLFFLPLFIVGFSAIAWFKRDKDSYVTPSYTLSEVS
jgi:DNA-binding winged helix-turn-helix (wHTH) protein